MKKLILILLSLSLLSSCYKDKGNYDYKDINELSVELEETYRVRLEDTTLIIRPKLSQTFEKNKNNLKFVWKHSKTNWNVASISGDTLSLADTMAIKITALDKDFAHYIRLTVLDESTNIPYTYQTAIQVMKPYHGAWMVLHEQDGVSNLGAVEYAAGLGEENNNVYQRVTGKELMFGASRLAVHNSIAVSYTGSYVPYSYNLFYIFNDNLNESGIFFQAERFAQKDNLTRMLDAGAKSTFKADDIRYFHGDNYGTVCLSNGDLFQGNNGARLYRAKRDQLQGGQDVDLTHAVKVGFSSMFYDSKGRRFIWYNCQGNTGGSMYPDMWSAATENKASLTNILLTHPNNVGSNVVDINKIPADQEVLYLGSGFQPGRGGRNNNIKDCYALANGASNSSYVYVFNSYGLQYPTTQPAFSHYYTIDTPLGLDKNSHFASSSDYNGVLFYTSGNTVYKLDFTQERGASTPIYTHSTGIAKVMKFAKYEYFGDNLDFSNYGFSVYRSLGVAFQNADGSSDFVVLNLSGAGDLDQAVQLFKGFGSIKDILFL